MVIRPMAAAYAMGETGRSAAGMGGKGGPAAFFSAVHDDVVLGSRVKPGAGLYAASPFFKIMGAVELMSEEPGEFDENLSFDTNPILL